MPLTPGTRLGPYEILAPIGAGGMGEVYRAKDPRLKREVAIKVLPSTFSKDTDRLRRFEQEAEAAGGLNHPNITAVYDIGSHDGSPYIVTELLEGETLRSRLGAGAIPVRKAIDYAVQIAKGLAAAHEKGIVHRDLKPENLFLTKDGRVKILDFGLAKLKPETGQDGKTDMKTVSGGTEPGVVLGTHGVHVAGAGARKARGQALGPVRVRDDPLRDAVGPARVPRRHRGRHDHGDPDQRAAGSVADQQGHPPGPGPDRAALPGEESGGAVRIGARRRLRYRGAVGNLESPIHGGRDLSGLSAPPAFSARGGNPGASPRNGSDLRCREEGRIPRAPVFSPAHVSAWHDLLRPLRAGRPDHPVRIRWEGRSVEIFVSRSGSPESRPFGLPGADILGISRNGEMALSLGRHTVGPFESSGTLARMGVAGGGAPRDVLEDVEWADWSPDGNSLAVVRDINGRNRLEFPIGKTLYETAGWISNPRVSPKGDVVAFLDHPVRGDNGGSVAVVDLSGKKSTLPGVYESLLGLAWSPRGEIWFTAAKTGSNRELYASSVSGKARLLTRVTGILTLHDVAGDGRVLLTHDTSRQEMLGRGPGSEKERDLSWLDWSQATDLTPDGQTLFFGESGEGGGPGYSVYVRKMDGSPAVRLGEGSPQALSPDGKWALAAIKPSDPQLVLYPTGAGEARILPREGLRIQTADWFPDGARLAINASEPGHGPRVFLLDLAGGKPRALTPEGYRTFRKCVSPDGKSIAVRGPDQKLYLYPSAGGEPTAVAGTTSEDTLAGWSGDGRALYLYRRKELPAKVYLLEIATGRKQLWKELMPADSAGVMFISPPHISPDGSFYAYSCLRTLSDLYLVEGLK